MLIKLTVPFILAATVFSASVPIQDKVSIVSNIACPPAQAQNPNQGNGLPTNTNGVLAVRDFLGTIVGYLAPPQNDQQGFTFTEDRTNALLATIIGNDDGPGVSGNGKHLSVRIGLGGSNSFLGGTVVSLPTSSNGPPSSGGSPSSGGASSSGSPSGGAPSSGGPSSGGPPPSSGGSPPPSGGPSSSGGASAGGSASGGASSGGSPSGGAPCSSCDSLGGLAGLISGGGPSSTSGSPSLAGTNALTVALGLVSAEELSSEEKSLKLKDAVGDAFNLSFLYDIESRQILGQKQVGNSSPQPTNFQFDHGHFCLFDQRRVQASQSATGLVNVFFVPA